MKILFFLILFFNFTISYTQEGYSVIYKYQERLSLFTVNRKMLTLPGLIDRLIFNDSLSLWYRLQQGVDPLSRKSFFGNKLIHHSILHNLQSDKYYSVVAWPNMKNAFLIEDSIKTENWIFLPTHKEIAGFNCRSALRVNERNDSTLVWFTDSIPLPAGPVRYFGFPGLVLEVYDQESGWHIMAKKVQKGFFQVTMPKDIMIIPRKDYNGPK